MMKRKTIWMPCLLIGLFVSIANINCTKARIEYIQHAEFVYINQTNYTITFPKGAVTIIINPKETISSKITEGGNKVVNENTYANTPKAFDIFGDYKTIYFDSVKCLDLSKAIEHHPANLKNYIAEKNGKRDYKFTYNFTEADYNRAVACP